MPWTTGSTDRACRWRPFTRELPARITQRSAPPAAAVRRAPPPAPSPPSSSSSSSTSSSGSRLADLLAGTGSRLAAAALAAMLTAGGSLLPLALPPPPPAAAVTEEQLLFLEAWRAVDRAYVDKQFNGQSWFRTREAFLKKQPMNSREETYAAIRTLLASLDDPFTRFLGPDQYAALRRSTSGSLTGVGVEVSFAPSSSSSSGGKAAASQQQQQQRLVVVAPTPGGPAEAAGVRPGDGILEIDGRSTSDLSLYAAGSLLQGPEGSEVQLKVMPAAGGPPRTLTLRRTPLTINPVDSALCSGASALGSGGSATSSSGSGDQKLGYIRIATFSKQTADKVRDAIRTLQKGGAERYVLDLRNNGGGVFAAGVEVGRMWMNEGEIVLIADSEGVRDVYEAQGTALEPSAPLSVLVNRGTASASEVLAGALHDGRGASVAGERTFGKGLIQTLVELSDGSAVAVTVARYQTPSGTDINRVGIAPDLLLSEEQLGAVPSSGEAFCRFVQQPGAPPLFK